MAFEACLHLCLSSYSKLAKVDAVLVHRKNPFHDHGGNL